MNACKQNQVNLRVESRFFSLADPKEHELIFLELEDEQKIQINTRENGIAVHVCWSTKDLIGALVVLIERAGEKTTLFHFKFYVTV